MGLEHGFIGAATRIEHNGIVVINPGYSHLVLLHDLKEIVAAIEQTAKAIDAYEKANQTKTQNN